MILLNVIILQKQPEISMFVESFNWKVIKDGMEKVLLIEKKEKKKRIW